MNPFLFVTDLDNTYVGDATTLETLQHQLSQHRQHYGSKIVYATGRSPTLYRQLKAEQQLLTPDALVCSVGTEIYFDDLSEQTDTQWAQLLTPGWDRQLIVTTAQAFPELTLQPESEQRPFKVSFFLQHPQAETLLTRLTSSLDAQHIDAKIIFSGGKDIDIVPAQGNKGQAMHFLQQHWQIAAADTVACGDSGNDIALFTIPETYGIIVGNARDELLHWHQQHPSNKRYLAQAPYAAGILEGLTHLGFL
ncbi:MAG: sucrose-phosphate phosphatase [Pseudomonadota bacterium]|nr:sucrose-phosphate phosphatase [Pseudomonadota bacterium]